jgi:hypothetical protein
LKLIYETFWDGGIRLAPAGPIKLLKVHKIPRLQGVLYALIWKIVGAGCANAPGNAILACVMGEKSVSKVCAGPLLFPVVLPHSSST